MDEAFDLEAQEASIPATVTLDLIEALEEHFLVKGRLRRDDVLSNPAVASGIMLGREEVLDFLRKQQEIQSER